MRVLLFVCTFLAVTACKNRNESSSGLETAQNPNTAFYQQLSFAKGRLAEVTAPPGFPGAKYKLSYEDNNPGDKMDFKKNKLEALANQFVEKRSLAIVSGNPSVSDRVRQI